MGYRWTSEADLHFVLPRSAATHLHAQRFDVKLYLLNMTRHIFFRTRRSKFMVLSSFSCAPKEQFGTGLYLTVHKNRPQVNLLRKEAFDCV